SLRSKRFVKLLPRFEDYRFFGSAEGCWLLFARRQLPLSLCTVVCHSTANKIFHCGLVNLVILMEIDCTCLFGLKPSIEKLVRIWKTCTLEKIHFHTSLESTQRQHQSLVSENGGVPLPLLSDFWINIMDHLAKLGKRLATPIT